MERFLSKLTPTNKENFSDMWKNNRLRKLRKDVYEHILSNEENSYFAIDNWAREFYSNNTKVVFNMIKDVIIPELEKLDWKCKTSFGSTALFIYSTTEPPANCYEELV